jgi:eukaryotic-like serine/threonine-protein kinase
MDQQRWKKIKTIFNAALAIPADERKGFVRDVSDGDPELESELLRLLLADERAGSYLESPLVPEDFLGEPLSYPPSIQVGDVLCQRFRIDRLIGSGGMGHVFEACDTVLHVRIGLKTIRPEIADHPASLARFRHEVLTARSLSHPNICRTFDLERETRVLDPVRGTEQAIVFLTMEFLEGETLADRLSRTGALTEDEAFAIARQMAGALACAHDHGIVHGDIKPANVMLVRRAGATSDPTHVPVMDLRVVITDFGLARMDPLFKSREFSTATRSMLPGGTLAYMAPEQLEGSVLSSATDIYAFGLVLFEMITGQRAFPASNLLAGIAQRVAGPPPSPAAIISPLSSSWGRAIEGCLRTIPEERFKSVADVVSALEGKRVRFSPAGWRRFFRRLATLKWPLWRLAAAAILLAITVALSVSALRLYQSRPDSKPESKVAPGALIYVPGVKNETGEKTFDHLTELIESALSQSVQINLLSQGRPSEPTQTRKIDLLSQGRAGDIQEQMKLSPANTVNEAAAREIAMRSGAVRVIFITVKGANGNYNLDVDIQQPDPMSPKQYREHWTRSFPWHSSGAVNFQEKIPDGLLTVIRNASEWIRQEAGESSNDIARLDAPPEGVTTGSWAALEDYAEGESLVRGGKREDAVTKFQKAVEKDPDFALAWGRMGDVLLSLYRDGEGYKAYDKALDAGLKSRLTRKEEYRIRGMRAVDTAEYQLAVDAFHDYTVDYPKDYIGWIYPMRPLRMLGRDAEAASNLHRALDLDPSNVFANYGLAEELIVQGQTGEARDWTAAHLKSKHPELAYRIETILYLIDGQYDQAASAAAHSQAVADTEARSYGYKIQASLAADRGDYRQAIKYLDDGLKEDARENKDPWKLLDRAYLKMKIGEFDNCLSDVGAALAASTSPWIVATADTVLGSAYLASPPHYHEAIRRELARMDRMLGPAEGHSAIFEFAKLRTQGEILLAEGKPRAAVEAFRKAELKDAPVESKEYLGRALSALAASEKNPAVAASLRQLALKAYSATALKPALIWCSAGSYLPGFYADQLQAYVQITRALGNKNANATAAESSLAHLRRQPNSQKQFRAL